MKNDMLAMTDGGAARCRVCGLNFVPSVPDDEALHKQTHSDLSRGGMPQPVRDFLKAFGWAVAYNDGGIDRLKDQYDPELGKLSVAYVYWNRARSNGALERDFDAFMSAHLKFADASISKDAHQWRVASEAIKPWEKFAG
jgi:hypothetical protein